MQILLAQHGDAVPKEVDEDRPLSDKGRADVERVAATLRQGQVSVSRIIHSGKTRAEQTSDILGSGSSAFDASARSCPGFAGDTVRPERDPYRGPRATRASRM